MDGGLGTCDAPKPVFFMPFPAFPLLCLAPWVAVMRLYLQAASARCPCHLAAWPVQPVGGTDTKKEWDARVSPSLLCWLGWIFRHSDGPSIYPLPAMQDHCGNQFLRINSVPGILNYHMFPLSHLPPDGGLPMLLILKFHHYSLFGIWASSLHL